MIVISGYTTNGSTDIKVESMTIASRSSWRLRRRCTIIVCNHHCQDGHYELHNVEPVEPDEVAQPAEPEIRLHIGHEDEECNE